MVRSFFLNGFAVFFARGGPLLALPFLTISLTLEEIGYYVLIQALVPLLSFVTTLNLSAAVLREGILHKGVASRIVASSLPFSIGLSIIGGIGWMMPNLPDLYFLCSVTMVLIAANGNQEIMISYFRAKNRNVAFLGISFFRAISVIIASLITWNLQYSFTQFLSIYAGFFVLISLIFTYLLNVNLLKYFPFLQLKPYLIYTLPLLPYTVGQWMLASSNRYVILYKTSASDAGLYGIAYLLSSPAVLLLSILGMMFSKDILEKIEVWKQEKFRIKAVVKIWGISLCGLILGGFLYYIDSHIYNFTKVNNKDFLTMILLISASIFPLCCNTIYGNLLFYYKKTTHIASGIFLAAILNIILTYIWVGSYGVIGAAYAAIVANTVYSMLTTIWSSRISTGQSGQYPFRELFIQISLSISLVGIIFLLTF